MAAMPQSSEPTAAGIQGTGTVHASSVQFHHTETTSPSTKKTRMVARTALSDASKCFISSNISCTARSDMFSAGIFEGSSVREADA